MKKIALIALFSILMHSCSSYRVTTDTFADWESIPTGFPQGTSFAVMTPEHKNPLFAKEVAGKIERLLRNKGFTIADSNDADYSLRFDFGMTSNVVTEQVAKQASEWSVRKKYHKGDSDKAEETTKISEKTVYVPEEKTIYMKELTVTVCKQSEQVWNGSARNGGTRGDLREALDYLIVSVFNHFGSNTNKGVVSQMTEDDIALIKSQ